MSLAKLTLIGMSKYFENIDSDLFDKLTLPEGVSKDTLVANILLQGGEFETLYGDPYFLQQMIGVWSDKWLPTFTKWVSALNIEYNPLENYDRQEDWTDQNYHTSNTSARRDSGNTRTFNNQDKRTIDTTAVSEDEVSAFDSSVYQPSAKNTVDNDGTDTVDYSGTIKDEYGEGTSGLENGNSTDTHGGRIHGNIGVTTSQQMLQAELDIAKWNLIEHITDIFMQEFCIMIYE